MTFFSHCWGALAGGGVGAAYNKASRGTHLNWKEYLHKYVQSHSSKTGNKPNKKVQNKNIDLRNREYETGRLRSPSPIPKY